MKRIADLIDQIEEEIEGAKDYAECYLDKKARNDSQWAQRYKEMANDELKHATYIHDYALEEIEILSRVYTPTDEMQRAWDESHRYYVEKVAWIKQMLAM